MAQHSRHSSALSGATYRSYASLVLVAAWVVMAAALVGGTAAARNPVENVHLAMTGNITQMVVSWKTANNASSVVQYGFSSGKYTFTASGSSDSYDSKSGFNHNVVLLGLSPATVYYYVCGDPSGSMSSEFNFTTPQPTFRPFRVAVYGDLGTDHSQDTINCLNGLAATDSVDFYWHLGDISYANDHPLQYENTWDKWFSLMEPAMSHKPYMVSVGNHESWCRNPFTCGHATRNFTTYKEKFRMPGPESGTNTNMFYSYDYGNVHFISLSTESDYPDSPIDPSPYSGWRVQDEYFQVNWLLQDLEMAQKNRKNVPWIIVGAHRPVYCSTDGEQHNGVPKRQAAKVQAWLEPLFQQYQVDLYFSGHAHLYSRTYPTYQNNPTQFNFTNPTSTVHVVAGGAGNREGLQKLSSNPPSWFAGGLDTEYGYGIMQVWNNTALTWSYYRSDTNQLYDTFTLVKDQHP